MSPRKIGVALVVAALAPLAPLPALAQQEIPDEAPAESAGAAPDKPDWTAKPVPALMVTVAARERLLGLAQAGGKRLVAVGQQGVILVSDDGKHWKQSPSPVSQMLTRVRFFDDKNGWAVGYDGVILKTADAGNSWVVQHLDAKARPLYDVLFTDASNGIAVGGYGTWLVTADGGKTWAAQENPISLLGLHINSLRKLSDGSLLLAGEKGLMARSTDAGATWTMFKPVYAGSFFGLLPLDGNAVMAYGMRGNIFVTDDVTKAVTQPAPDPLDYAPEMIADAAAITALGWKRLENPSKESLFGAMREKGGEVLLVGINGTALRADVAAGKAELVKLKADETLVDVLPYGGRMLAVGKRGAQDLGEIK